MVTAMAAASSVGPHTRHYILCRALGAGAVTNIFRSGHRFSKLLRADLRLEFSTFNLKMHVFSLVMKKMTLNERSSELNA